MSITTPRGMRIRLALDYSFALIGRLYPSVSAEAFFRTVEGLDSVPAAAACAAGIVGLALAMPPALVIALVVVAEVATFLAVIAGLHRSRAIAEAGSAYRQAAWYGIPIVVAVVVGLSSSGWLATLAYFAGRVLGRAASTLVDRALARATSPWRGVPLLSAERNFLYAYRLHAGRLGKPTGLLPSDEEFDGQRWQAPFGDFVARFPTVVDKWV